MTSHLIKIRLWFLIIFSLSAISSFMAMANDFSQESHLNNSLNNEIALFWQSGKFSSFQGVDDKRVNYAAFIKNEKAPCLVISPGRSEGYLKYQEMAFDLYKQPFNLFIIDHRGQGLSERLLDNPHKGYVKHFDDYADDLHFFINTEINNYCSPSSKPLLLSHSMGGAIAIRMMQKYPHTIKAALLSSPMIAINKGGLPDWLAKTLINSGQFFNNIFSDQAWYFVGQGDYQANTFEDNTLMQSAIRYENFINLYKQEPKLQLGGVTFNWLKQAIATHSRIFEQLDKITTPVTILQAGDDTVVDNQAQNHFCSALNKLNPDFCQNGQPIIIADAKHELFFEKDLYRNQALAAIVNWLKLNQNND